MTLEYVVQTIIFSYGFVFLNFALAALCVRGKSTIHWLTMALLADFGLMCMAGGISIHVRYEGFLVNLSVIVPMLLLAPIGGAFALECLSMRGKNELLQRVASWLTAAVSVSISLLVLFGLPWKGAYIAAYAWLFLFFLVIVLAQGSELRPVRSMRGPLRQFYLIVCLDAILALAMAVSRLFELFTVLYGLWMVQIASIVAISFIMIRSPETFRIIQAAAKNIRYERSNLSPERIRECLRHLESLMTDERLYLDSDLVLEDLARRVELTPHQLSELINIHLGKNFAWYVNSYRIESAKEMLALNREMSIIRVAYEAGFNSKSAFNASFRSHTGKTPSQYRRGVHPEPAMTK